MGHKGFFVDDEKEGALVYAKLLSSTGEKSVQITSLPVKELAELASEIFDAKPDIVALDFRLDEMLETIKANQAFKGSSLAQQLRDKIVSDPLADFPIVLVSAEEKFNHLYRPDSTAHDLFDRTYVKEQVAPSKDIIRQQIYSLCQAYENLKRVWNGDRLAIFGLVDDERRVVEVQELKYLFSEAAAPHIIARGVLRHVIDRTGILLPDIEVAARLGIDDPGLVKISNYLINEGLLYNGIFHEGWRRWWAHRFDVWAEAFFGRRLIGLTGAERTKILNDRLGLDLKPAQSAWSRSPHERFAFACSCCNRPTEIRHSLAAYDPAATRFGQRRRICWDCIQSDNYLHAHLHVDSVDENLVDEVKRSERSSDEFQIRN